MTARLSPLFTTRGATESAVYGHARGALTLAMFKAPGQRKSSHDAFADRVIVGGSVLARSAVRYKLPGVVAA